MGDVYVKWQLGYFCEWNGEKGVVKGLGAGYAHVHGFYALRVWHFDAGEEADGVGLCFSGGR